MNSLVCGQCKERKRVTHPVMVPYMTPDTGGRSSVRRALYVCWYCDSTDLWPNFTRTSPKVTKE